MAEQVENPQIVNPRNPDNPDNWGNAMEMLQQLTDFQIKELKRVMKHEFIIPVYISLTFVAAFWFTLIHGSLIILLILSVNIIFYGIVTRDNFNMRGVRPSQMLDIRLLQTTMMHMNMLLVHIFGPFLRTQYFKESNYVDLGKQIKLFVSSNQEFMNITLHTILIISNQMFWFSLSCLILGRVVANLFYMSRTPEYRILLKYESRILISTTLAILIGVIGFNFAANFYQGSKPWAMFLVANLLLWIICCILKSTLFQQDILAARTNDVNGLIKMSTVTVCQALLCGLYSSSFYIVKDVILDNFSSKINLDVGLSNSYQEHLRKLLLVWGSPILEVALYLHGIEETSKANENSVITLASIELWLLIASAIAIGRGIRHLLYDKKLGHILDQMTRED